MFFYLQNSTWCTMKIFSLYHPTHTYKEEQGLSLPPRLASGDRHFALILLQAFTLPLPLSLPLTFSLVPFCEVFPYLIPQLRSTMTVLTPAPIDV